MAKAKKPAAKTKAVSGKKAARPARPARGSEFGALTRQLLEITATVRRLQEAVEQLIALHQGIEPGRPAEPNSTVGSIPHITLVPPRAA